jgi:hypothetical protein
MSDGSPDRGLSINTDKPGDGMHDIVISDGLSLRIEQTDRLQFPSSECEVNLMNIRRNERDSRSFNVPRRNATR